MRIAHQPGSNKTTLRGLFVFLILLVIAPLGALQAQEQSGPAEVTAASVGVEDGAVIIDIALSRPAGVRSFTLTAPDRLVFDIQDTLLALEPDAQNIWREPMEGISILEILQFSLEPPVVRIVAEVSDASLEMDRQSGTDGIKLSVYRGESPFAETGPGSPPAHILPVIQRFWHEPTDDGHDSFVIDFSFGVVLPQIRIESPTILLLRFPNTDIVLPSSAPDNFATSVEGNLVERMRAERLPTDEGMNTEIRLAVKDTSAIGYTLETSSENTLEFVLFTESRVEPVEMEQPAPPAARPVPDADGQMMVLASEASLPVPSDAPIRINRVQFESVDSRTDRFYIFYEGGEIEPRVQRFNYPTRVALYFPDSAVVLPEEMGDRYQTPVDGVLADELKVYNRVIEDVGPECQFVFYFPSADQENIGFVLDYVDPGELHLDFYRAQVPVDVEGPVEVNLSMPEVETAVEETPVVPEPTPIAEEAPEVVEEEPAPEATGQPEVEETPAPEAPAGEAERSLPLIMVSLGEVTDEIINFNISTSEPMPEPEWIEYRYPDRLGLRFPLADVELLDADPGVYTTYTHIRAIPLVRAIMKDREDEQYTAVVFTLGGSLEEYTGEFERDRETIQVAFHYSPLPEEPEEVEVGPPPEPEIETPEVPVVETPPPPEPTEVVVEEPAEIVEPEPQPEEQAQEVEVFAAEETAEVEEAEAGAPMAPGAPPFGSPAAPLPRVAVSLGEATENLIVFHVSTSEPLPVPEWVEYRYPDRLGLLFPLVEVDLLGQGPETYMAYTGTPALPMVRTITKDREDEQYTAVVFTLGGSLEEYTGELDWNGTELAVAFHYMPMPEEIEEPAPVEPPPSPQPPVAEAPPPEMEIDIEAVEVEAEAVPEEPQRAEVSEPEIEQPVMIAEVESEVEPAPVEEAEEAPEQPEESEWEEVGVVEVSAREVEYQPDAAVISGFSFERAEGADVLRLTSDRPLEEWEVVPVNFPTKFMVRFPNSRPVFPNGDPRRYEKTCDGTWIDQLVATATVSLDTSYTVLSIYAHGVESTALLDYDVQAAGNEWALSIYEKGARSPFMPEVTPVMEVVEEEIEEFEFVPGREIPEPISLAELVREEEPEMDLGEIAAAAEPRISMRLEDANIRDVLQLIAEQANLNISINPSVSGKITISLSEIGLFDLLDLLGAQMGFSYVVKYGVYIFGSAAELQEQFIYWDRWYIELSYADPDQVRGILVSLQILANNQIQIYRANLQGTSVQIASPRLILTGETRDLERAYRIIAAIDQAPMMIQVDFQILNTSMTHAQNFGFQFNAGTGQGTTNLFFSEQASQEPDMGPFPQGFDRLRAGLANVYSINYVINYLLEEGYAELMNQSSLTVANNQMGELFVGETIPYRSTYQVSELGRVTQRVAQQSVGLRLRFRPHANPDGTVTIVLIPSNTNLLELTDVGPRTVDQQFQTTVRVKDGEPFMVGGFIRDEERVNYDRFPFLSDLPLLGHLFRNREVQNVRSELIFVFTPHIIKPTRHLPEVQTDRIFDIPVPSVAEGY